MQRESIAIDVDDTLANHVEVFIKFSNKHFGTKLELKDYRDNWSQTWGVDFEETERRAAVFHAGEDIFSMTIKEDAQATVAQLAKDYDLYIVTARNLRLKDLTHRWVEQHFPGTFKGIHFVPTWDINNKVSKADVCREIGATYLVDDSPVHCNVAASGGMKAVLFGNYIWVAHEKLEDGVISCGSWKEVGNHFSNLPT